MINDKEIISKVQLLRIMRLMGNFGLVDSKNILERWLGAMGLDGFYDGEHLVEFFRFFQTFKTGKNIVDASGIIRPNIPEPLTDEDVIALSKYGTGG